MVNLHMNVMTMGGCRVRVIKQARINLTVALKQTSKKKKQNKKSGQTGVSGLRGLRGGGVSGPAFSSQRRQPLDRVRSRCGVGTEFPVSWVRSIRCRSPEFPAQRKLMQKGTRDGRLWIGYGVTPELVRSFRSQVRSLRFQVRSFRSGTSNCGWKLAGYG